MARTRLATFGVLGVLLLGAMQPAVASLGRGIAAFSRQDYARAVQELSPLAQRGNARAEALLGFLYENGFGVPQAYDAAADLYAKAATQGDPFGQNRLGLLYDKGHGVPQDVVLAYKWINLSAAHTSGKQRDYYQRLRDAVASKMSASQITEGQRLAQNWLPRHDAPN
jgi:uncharacterized protein